MVQYIETTAWEPSEEALRPRKKNWLVQAWLWVKFAPRNLRRRLLRAMNPQVRAIFRYAAYMFGYFFAWFFFYVTLIIAFSYGLGIGFLCVFMWCLLAATIISVFSA